MTRIASSLATLLALTLAAACTVGDPDPDSRAGEGLGNDGGDISSLAARVCATGATTSGVDVSYYNGTIDWAKAKAAGVQFAIIRVSDGTGFKDPKFASYAAGAKAQGLVRGAYQFFRPAQDVTAQADLMIAAQAAFDATDLPPTIDVEATGSLSPATVAARVAQWVDRVKAQTGRTPIVYTGKYFWRDDVGGSTKQADSALWVAQYTSLCPDIPAPWSKWTFWQYSESGRVPGIPGDVDMDRFNGSLDDLRAFAGGGAATASLQPLAIAWTRATSGAYTFTATAVPAAVDHVDVYVDDYLIGTGTRAGGFALDYTFSAAAESRRVEVRGLDASGAQLARGVGLLDSIAGTGVFIRQTAAATFEIGLERAPADVAAIEVVVDGTWMIRDDVSGQTRAGRKAVLSHFATLGSRQFAITTYSASGAVRGTLRRTFTLR
jgi:GH25 family lysozyme M1 (1,4-beta-N-acetylmuramidase)